MSDIGEIRKTPSRAVGWWLGRALLKDETKTFDITLFTP